MRRLRVQLTVLLALLGLLVLAWGATIFLGARDAARTSRNLQSTVDRFDGLRRTTVQLGRSFVDIESDRRAHLLTGRPETHHRQLAAERRTKRLFGELRRLAAPWPGVAPALEAVAADYRSWLRAAGRELRVRERRGPAAAARVAADGLADRRFKRLCDRQAAFEDQLTALQATTGRSQGRSYRTAQALALRTAMMVLAAVALIAFYLRRAVGAPADALRSASGRLAPLDLGTPVELGVENELGAVAADLETMRRRLAGRVEQILTNLVGNAIKYSPEGGEVLVAVEVDEDCVKVSVRDQGIGMSPREMGQLFEMFYRVDREEVRRAGGTGLGLYITKRLVEMHGGRIWAESWPGVGSVFAFTLPTSSELAGSGAR